MNISLCFVISDFCRHGYRGIPREKALEFNKEILKRIGECGIEPGVPNIPQIVNDAAFCVGHPIGSRTIQAAIDRLNEGGIDPSLFNIGDTLEFY